jgi:hypothetical protein
MTRSRCLEQRTSLLKNDSNITCSEVATRPLLNIENVDLETALEKIVIYYSEYILARGYRN